MAKIKVLQPGLFSTIQDLGRSGFQKYGVPKSGVMDTYAMRICNLILGNTETTSVMEITFLGPQLEFDAATKICISGADLSPTLNSEKISSNHIISVNKGDVLKFGRRISGFRSYLGIKGGFKTEVVMNSQSWYDGITSSTRLDKGMELEYTTYATKAVQTFSSIKPEMEYLNDTNIEAYPGPEFDQLNLEQQKILFSENFSLSESSNRMAIQFKEKLENSLSSIITGPVVPGTVQLTPSGQLIALMRDCQTTGGYPRVLQLSDHGIQVLSQKIPGEKINFFRKEYSLG
ncbi:biotin-dependent carboxyltransferase family protein [Christiangramia aquimixticola]|uniref:5-oxoprolinase subunit C family protein n=1 Tax=Christiangramia aquimixticola TaxID=1697558 RepID=UPI003AA9CF6D